MLFVISACTWSSLLPHMPLRTFRHASSLILVLEADLSAPLVLDLRSPPSHELPRLFLSLLLYHSLFLILTSLVRPFSMPPALSFRAVSILRFLSSLNPCRSPLLPYPWSPPSRLSPIYSSSSTGPLPHLFWLTPALDGSASIPSFYCP